MENKAVTHFDDVSIAIKANIYFDGKVVSHSLVLKDGTKKTIGMIYPGSYVFNTGASEKMEIIAGACMAKIEGEPDFKGYKTGEFFKVPSNSSFEISVETGIVEYICSFE
jgi:uncharacterized protein YaiE (UPF0345 family)